MLGRPHLFSFGGQVLPSASAWRAGCHAWSDAGRVCVTDLRQCEQSACRVSFGFAIGYLRSREYSTIRFLSQRQRMIECRPQERDPRRAARVRYDDL